MRLNPQVHAKALSKTLGPHAALRIARECYEATRDMSESLQVAKATRDPKFQKRAESEGVKTSRFWDQVFGILAKAVHPGLSRKALMAQRVPPSVA